MNITNENTDRYVDEMLTVFKDDTEAVDAIRAVYQKNKSVIKTDQINFCLERYVNSELDLTTDSTRGLGRASEFWPRIGGYYRKNLFQLPTEKILELNALITSLIVKSYLFQLLLSDQSSEISSIKTPEELYEKWVPEIYRFNIEVIPEGPRSNLIALIEDDINLLKRFFQDHNLSSDKRDDILSGYIGAGVTMRMIQRLSK